MAARTYRFPKIDRVVHGEGAIEKVADLVEELGAHRVLILTGATLAAQTPVVDALMTQLGSECVGVFAEMKQHAPKRDIDRAVALARSLHADCLIGIGGSSVTDATKIVAVRLLGVDDPQSAMPQILIPTTLSAGEYTPASGMTGDIQGVKTYVVDSRMAPFAVVLDPAITMHTPPQLWLSSGMKSVEHACEMLWSPKAHPLASTLAKEALRMLIDGLDRTHNDSFDLDARMQCQLAGWMSMSGVSNVQVYLSHTMGHQIGARWDVPHGYTSGITLPPVMRYLASAAPDAVAFIAESFIGAIDPAGSLGVEGAEALSLFVKHLGLPTALRAVGASRDNFSEVALATLAAGRATGFAGSMTEADVVALLDEMW